MAQIIFHPIVSEVHNRLDDVVFYRRNGKNFMRKRPKKNNPNTPAQKTVRSAFTVCARIWSSLPLIRKPSWNNFAAGSGMNGFNTFISLNSDKYRNGSALELYQSMNEDHLTDFAVQTGPLSGSITCSFSTSSLAEGKTVTLFTQEINEADGLGNEEVHRYMGPVETVSPAVITGLTPGAAYFIYAVVTDKAIDTATTVSMSVNAKAVARR
jgi:hypothetical protein